MRNFLMLAMVVVLGLSACQHQKKDGAGASDNPFFSAYTTPYNVPPFEQIKPEHYMPALDRAMAEHKKEVEAIINNNKAATFENTIVALDDAGKMLSEVTSVYFGLKSADGTEGIMAIATDVAKKLSAHSDDISLNPDLFNRVEAVYNQKEELKLTGEQQMLLEDTYKGFVRSGVSLADDKKTELRQINSRLSELFNNFSTNVLTETNSFKLVLDKQDDLAGLPESVIAGAAETAKEMGLEGKWVFTTHKPSMLPFLQYADKRELREKLYKGYYMRGNNNDSLDNKAIIEEIVNLRVQKANLLDYETYADYVLEERMAKTSDKVYELLNELWDRALPVAKKERAAMQAIIDREKGGFKLASWDWWYYAEKVRQEKYNLDENEVRPYFELNNVRDGAFAVATKLWGLTFEEITGEFPKPHADAQVFKVLEADGSHKGILYMDWHPRATKKQGAWCGAYRKQSRRGGEEIPPVVTIVCNFSKPVGDMPALLSFDEASTLFHEFGHGLHQLFSDCTYNGLSGTSVPRDFVELPSQVMENWAGDPEVMKEYARHYKTGEVIPDELVTKLKNSGHFNQGFATTEYLAAALLDMNYHTQKEEQKLDVNQFEEDYLKSIGLIPEIISRYKSTYFMHIFASSGYTAGYYSYIWSGVLDADAFEAFKETSLYDQATAKSFRENILERGGTVDAMEMYKNFRGREPKIEALLRQRGLE
ncbi:M3 family metallopeptidase [Carboxylicivirga sediminis]|uniref:M3 family metallopeptidase n=1 Tax=Carboxylicivirga sediminis TaxID=2006564 RepID=A0A941F6F6_9BACT|nr:M3 family metallopeptidase [Carboxylicivirga sediminis]MBR8537257.1 M3 family metallopeptidase [Carboxylicivirga sediminis]